MTLKECFEAINGDYNGVMGRLLSEERVKKFLMMFTQDTSYSELCSAMDSGDYETAFRAAHTLKGVCGNLGLDSLTAVASEITEALRGNQNNGADAILPRVKETYDLTIALINAID